MHISIIDDEKILAAKMSKKLQSAGYASSTFSWYQDFMRHGNADSQLYIVDLSLGDGSGFDIIQWLRKDGNTKAPIIVMSGYGNSEKVVYGLDLGADDYLVKPVVPEVLVAHVRAVLRRPGNLETASMLRYGDISLNPKTKEVFVSSERVGLTKTEAMVLELFLTYPDSIISRDRLITWVWGGHRTMDVRDNTINVTISNIKKKLGWSFQPKVIYNQGYTLK